MVQPGISPFTKSFYNWTDWLEQPLLEYASRCMIQYRVRLNTGLSASSIVPNVMALLANSAPYHIVKVLA